MIKVHSAKLILYFLYLTKKRQRYAWRTFCSSEVSYLKRLQLSKTLNVSSICIDLSGKGMKGQLHIKVCLQLYYSTGKKSYIMWFQREKHWHEKEVSLPDL